jgi:hypothetical protein
MFLSLFFVCFSLGLLFSSGDALDETSSISPTLDGLGDSPVTLDRVDWLARLRLPLNDVIEELAMLDVGLLARSSACELREYVDEGLRLNRSASDADAADACLEWALREGGEISAGLALRFVVGDISQG